jgi:hypothetical protein
MDIGTESSPVKVVPLHEPSRIPSHPSPPSSTPSPVREREKKPVPTREKEPVKNRS